MRATIEMGGARATIENWHWTSRRQVLADVLNRMLDPIGPSGADPAPNYHAALEAIERLGGKILDYELPEYVHGRVY